MNTTHPTLSEALTEIQTLSTLADLLCATGIARHLSQQPTFTLLAPANQAFATLPPGMVDEWSCPDNQYQLSSIMRHHILPFRWLISSTCSTLRTRPLVYLGRKFAGHQYYRRNGQDRSEPGHSARFTHPERGYPHRE